MSENFSKKCINAEISGLPSFPQLLIKVLFILSVVALITGCNYFDNQILQDPKYASGRAFGTNEKVMPKSYQFNDYTVVTGFPKDSGTSSLGIYDGDKEVYYETSNDGVYDTIMQVNFNNDGLRDFLAGYAFEDGAALFGILSKSDGGFSKVEVLDHWNDAGCIIAEGAIGEILPLIIKDLNNNGDDEIILNLFKTKNDSIALNCTDTIFFAEIRR